MSRGKALWVALLLTGMSAGAGLAQAALPRSGDAVARVVSQELVEAGATGPARAGESSSLGSPMAAVMLTPQPKAKKKSGEGRLLPFSRIAFATSSGTLGYGGQIATPLMRLLNLRAGVNLFNFDYGLGVDGANYQG
jgi:hypothetical protein